MSTMLLRWKIINYWFFSDGKIKVCDVNKIVDKNSPLQTMLKLHPNAFENVLLQVGGYGVYWDENMTVSDNDLYESGKAISLTKSDFLSFVSKRVVNTAEAAGLLDC